MATELGSGCRSSASVRRVSPIGCAEITFDSLTHLLLKIPQTTAFVGTQEGLRKHTRAPSNLPPHISALFTATGQIRCHTDRPTIFFVFFMDGPPRFAYSRPLCRSLVRSAMGREWSRRWLGKRSRGPCKVGVPKVRRYRMGEDQFHG